MCCSGILLVAYFVVGNKSKRRYREIALVKNPPHDTSYGGFFIYINRP